MTDANRAQFRKWLADMVAVATSPTGVMHRTMKHHYPAPDEMVVEIGVRKKGKDTPPLTTAQQLALSVLVGEPDRAVLSAFCDCLIEMGHEYAAECYEKGKRDGNPMAEAVKAMTPAVTAYTDACRHLVNGLAARLAAPPAVTG